MPMHRLLLVEQGARCPAAAAGARFRAAADFPVAAVRAVEDSSQAESEASVLADAG